MSVHIDKGRALSSLNMTPMIDIVFLLLIFFLVATRFEEEDPQMTIQSPEASEAVPIAAKPNRIEVSVDQKGHFFLRHEQISAQRLEVNLFQAARKNPGRQSVIIRADKRCSWQAVATVLNLCVKTGIAEYTWTAD